MSNIKTGITSEVLTISSNVKIIDIFNKIISEKAEATVDWINNLGMDKNSRVTIVGTYFTGIGIAKSLKKDGYGNVCIIDIYPHLKDFINTSIGGNVDDIGFSSDLELIKDNDIVIDTTGFGGLSPEFTKDIKTKVFLIEDPVAEENDESLKEKNNINLRLECMDCESKAILKTMGLNTKTSGTMTLTMGVLLKSIQDTLNFEGVLYSSCEMRFFEDIIFKEKDMGKFIELANLQALKVSTIKEYDIDKVLEDNIGLIKSDIIDIGV